jgi:nicotinamidase-related amidase
MAKPRIHLLVIDPQNDFCDIPGATLPVNGAAGDMERLAKLVDRIGHKVDDVHVTLDSHRLVDIAHPAWWVNDRGENPAPFTLITANDIDTGVWTPRNPNFRARSLEYARALEAGGKYALFIWPPHCLIGTWGHNVHEALNAALQRWSEKQFALVDYVTKGSNPWTEHYGALMAEVPDPSDPGTSLNTAVLDMLAQADIIGVAGEASSHCVLTTVNQIVENIGDEHLKKFHLITDCMSPVGAVPGGPDFPAIAIDWLRDMQNRGLVLTKAEDFLA